MKKYFRSIHKTGIAIQILIILILTLAIFFAAYYKPGPA